MLRKWGTLVLLLLVTPLLALAQNTGKLTGRVLDAQTGEPLPGANVIIEGTQLGTATDVDGNYFIIGVPVGVYDIQASFVGFQAETRSGVEINAGYTREINFSLRPGAELDEIVVEYERPLIQKDAIGVPAIATAEQIANLPVRGVANVAALQGGVVKAEGSGNLYIRGGREQEVAYYVDGVKVVGAVAVPTQAVQEQEMLIGSIPAKYGDAMSGIISITTKTGSPSFSGSLEAITSEVLDDYGYNQIAATLGGPIIRNKLNFFLSGEFGDFADPGPRAIGFPQLSEDAFEFLQNNPQAVRIINDETGESSFIPFPGNVEDGATGADVLAILEGQVPEGYHLADAHPNPVFAPEYYLSDPSAPEITRENAKPNDASQNFTINGNFLLNPTETVRLRAGGSYEQSEGKAFSNIASLYAHNLFGNQDRETWRLYGSWTQRLSQTTFYQLAVNYTDYKGWNYSDGFGREIEETLFYGDIEHAANAVAARYKRYDAATDTYVNTYADGSLPNVRDIQSTWSPPGYTGTGYQKWHYNLFGFRANATTQVGLHQIEFGGEYEQQTQRYISVGAGGLARFYNDDNVEGGADRAVSQWSDFDFSTLNNNIFYYGYNYLGTEEVDDQNVNNFTDPNYTGADKYNLAPYQPIYYAGYIQDKIEYKDLVLNIGVRLDVFDNNTVILRDRFSLLPIVRAGDVGGAPAGIGSDYAVYFNNSGAVVGYRDLDGRFYNAQGQNADPLTIRDQGAPQVKTDANGNEIRRVTDEVFTDYEPQVNFQPRIGISFPVTDQALFFASYDVVTQRPSENQFDTVQQWQQATERSKNNNNAALEPERTTNYELGFRQRVGARAALQVSGFYKQIENKIQRRIVQNVFPSNYQTYENVDFGTVRGIEFEIDLRRTNNVEFNANYTLSFAQGTGSDAGTVGQIIWRQETNPFYPRFIAPLDFDQRHKFNVTLDYRLGENEGPMLFGAHPLSNFGFNVVATVGSGLPYTRRNDTSPIYTGFNGFLEGTLNGETQPGSALVNLRVDRRFRLGGANLVAFLWVQNLLDSDNIFNVYSQTGLPDEDGFLAGPEGSDLVPSIAESRNSVVAQSFAEHYRMALKSPFNYGIPRMTRLGVRLDF